MHDGPPRPPRARATSCMKSSKRTGGEVVGAPSAGGEWEHVDQDPPTSPTNTDWITFRPSPISGNHATPAHDAHEGLEPLSDVVTTRASSGASPSRHPCARRSRRSARLRRGAAAAGQAGSRESRSGGCRRGSGRTRLSPAGRIRRRFPRAGGTRRATRVGESEPRGPPAPRTRRRLRVPRGSARAATTSSP